MYRILLWLLPLMDVFGLKKILTHYSSLGVKIPAGHVRWGMMERFLGYLPAGLFLGWYSGPLVALVAILGALALVGPVELHLMWKGARPWGFFRGKPRRIVARIFLLETYNVLGYFLLGVLIGWVLSG